MRSSGSGIVSPAYAGVALLLAWIYLLFYANTAGIEAAAPISLMSSSYMISSLAMLAVTLVIAFSPRIGITQLTAVPTKIVVPIGMAGGTLLLIVNGLEPHADSSMALLVAGGILTGMFSGIMAQQWALAYSRVGLKTAICSFPMLVAVALGVSTLAMYLPQSTTLAVIVALPMASEILFHAVRHDVMPRYTLETESRDRPINFILLLLPIFVCGFATGFLDYFSSHSTYTFVFYALATFIPLIAASVFIVVANRDFITPSLVVPCCFLLALIVPFFTLFDATPTARFISIGELGTEVVLFIASIGFAEFFSLSALKTYALSRTVTTLLNSVGWYVGGFCSNALNGLGNSLASLTIVLVSIEVLSVVLIVSIVKAQKVEPGDDAADPGPGKMGASAFGRSGQEALKTGSEPALIGCEAAGAGKAILAGGAQAKQPFPNSGAGADKNASRSGEDGEAGAGDFAKRSRPAEFAASTSTATSRPDHLEADMHNSQSSPSNRFLARCAAVGKRYGLSNREVDVLALLARGFSSARIQRELFIAAGTVNYHTRNIYAKLGVHSKQEVIDLVASDDAEG